MGAYSALKQIPENDALLELLQIGLPDFKQTIEQGIFNGAVKEKSTLQNLIRINKMSKIIEKPYRTAAENSEIVKPNIEMGRDEELISKIKNNHRN